MVPGVVAVSCRVRGGVCRRTFEVLVRFLGTGDLALAAVAEVAHDIDLKDAGSSVPKRRASRR
jgi:hypothetical protein